jgi:hypothetical protein
VVGEEAAVSHYPDDANSQRRERDSRIWAKSRAASIALKEDAVPVPLEPVAERDETEPKGVAERVESLRGARQLHLVLHDLCTDSPPGVAYELFLDLPPKPTAQDKKDHSVGLINFFGFVGRGDAEGDKTEAPTPLSFDVTDIARRLQRAGKLKDKPVLTIIPVGKPDREAKPVIGEITLTES